LNRHPVVAFIHNRVFHTDVFFIRMENTVGARSAQWRQVTLQRPLLRGRKPVRADRRLRTDDEPVRTQSAILHKTDSRTFFTFP
jgi:hypothetical protein